VQVPYVLGSCPEALASGKLVYREVCSEGSQTAKSGTDEQERYTRLLREDKQAHHCNVQRLPNLFLVDIAGIGGRNVPLPGEASGFRVLPEESAEAIVAKRNELCKRKTISKEASQHGKG
jgi:hypothetical protein